MSCYACDAQGNCKGLGMKGVAKWTLMGALIECYGKDLLRVFNLVSRKVGPQVTAWNNAPERTYEDVLSLLQELDI